MIETAIPFDGRAETETDNDELTQEELIVNDRTCIVTRQAKQPGELIRFVAGPNGQVVPDLKSVLPGRGCWVSADAETVALAVKRKIFGRALKTDVIVDPDLVQMIERLMVKNALGSLGLLRKSGNLMTGSAKVDDLVRSGKAGFVLHALDGAADGIRKITQARKATREMGGKEVPGFALFTSDEMSLAFGGENVIHAAANAGQVSNGALGKLIALARYRGTGQLNLEDSGANRSAGKASDDDYDDDFDDEDDFDDDDMEDEDEDPAMKKPR